MQIPINYPITIIPDPLSDEGVEYLVAEHGLLNASIMLVTYTSARYAEAPCDQRFREMEEAFDALEQVREMLR